MKKPILCAWCGKSRLLEQGAINRARSRAAPLYCGKTCSGLGRRKHKTKEQRVAEKAQYDHGYRLRDPLALKIRKAAYHQRTYDPKAAALERKKRAPWHLEYCRRPEYKKYKSIYDLKRRAAEFGEFSEAYKLLLDIEKEIGNRASRYEIYSANGTLNKALQRRRAYANTFSR